MKHCTATEAALFPNADKVQHFIESEPDPVVRSLLSLAYEEFILAAIAGKHPQGGLDILYCFEFLQAAFKRKDAMANALKGEFGEPGAELEWS